MKKTCLFMSNFSFPPPPSSKIIYIKYKPPDYDLPCIVLPSGLTTEVGNWYIYIALFVLVIPARLQFRFLYNKTRVYIF